ncbi:MAG: APC family permease [Pseudomonadota bacterium]
MGGPSLLIQLKERLLGRAKDFRKPEVYHAVLLGAFLAWVGLGADGLSSSCYGPEEAFRALGEHRHLALLLGLATAVTVMVISAGYAYIIELFPSGGGGYTVASKLLGPKWGLLSGCALLVDYCYTITMSIAAGVDAIFSYLPPSMQPYKLGAGAVLVVILIVLNLRGIKESIKILLPIFLVFVIGHTILISYGLLTNLHKVPPLLAHSYTRGVADIQSIGLFATLFIFLRAYSLGAGTYTGIEAVSNGLATLQEPRQATGRRTMVFMAASLSFTAGGFLVNYLLNDIYPVFGQTLNATWVQALLGTWTVGGLNVSPALLFVILLSEGALLFVAAQAGFVDGPRVLANMANDSWVPRQFSHLSDRLVVKNGIYIMGLVALALLFITRGRVSVLVVLYSINVFITFTLSQLGMIFHWWQDRARNHLWKRRMLINGMACVLSVGILVVTSLLKMREGAWVNFLIVTPLFLLCLLIKRHYGRVRYQLQTLDDVLLDVPTPDKAKPLARKDLTAPTAAILVSAYNGLGVHAFLSIHRLFPGHFKNFVFVSAGMIDSSRFKGIEEVKNLEESTRCMLGQYVKMANRLGLYAESRYTLGVDRISALDEVCQKVASDFPKTIFFAGRLIFPEDNFFVRLLHNEAAHAVQRRLQYQGHQMMVLPVRAFRA